MTQRPDFSRDTGPGRAGIDNEHMTGRTYSSHQVEDTGCGLCRTQVGYWESNGVLVYGTEGQYTEYIVMLGRGPALPKCTICDTCLKPLVDSGKLEIFTGPDGKPIEELSETVRREVFTLGARSTLAQYIEIRSEDLPEEVGESFILPLDSETIRKTMEFAKSIGCLQEAERAGQLYAVAALAFGHVGRDPGFDLAAARYVTDHPYAGFTSEDREECSEEEKLLRLIMEADGASRSHCDG